MSSSRSNLTAIVLGSLLILAFQTVPPARAVPLDVVNPTVNGTAELIEITGHDLPVPGYPFSDYALQGSSNTTDGVDGDWESFFSPNLAESIDLAWQRWNVSPGSAYSADQMKVAFDFWGGFAMYRFQPVENTEAIPGAVPEPATLLLLGSGLLALVWLNRRREV